MNSTPVAHALEGSDWSNLLPPQRVVGGTRPQGAPSLVDALDLGEGHWLALLADAAGTIYPVPLVLTGTRAHRSRPGDGSAERLVELLAGGTRTMAGFEVTSWHLDQAVGESGIDVDQTNESVIVGSRAVVKWSFVAEPGPHPAPPILDLLVKASFAGMPRPWGMVQWCPQAGDEARLLCSVDDYVPGVTDGWTWLVDDIRVACESGVLEPLNDIGRSLGDLVADLHLALVSSLENPVPFDARKWERDAHRDLDDALAVTSGDDHRLLARCADGLIAAMIPSDTVVNTPVILVHGDLHVGQVLRSAGSYLVIDFDGNPVADPAERARPQPAVTDVASMAQSLVHAGLVVQHHQQLSPAVVRDATRTLESTFIARYRQRLRESGHDDVLTVELLVPSRLRQLCREFSYAARHLPRWSYVPRGALLTFVKENDDRS